MGRLHLLPQNKNNKKHPVRGEACGTGVSGWLGRASINDLACGAFAFDGGAFHVALVVGRAVLASKVAVALTHRFVASEGSHLPRLVVRVAAVDVPIALGVVERGSAGVLTRDSREHEVQPVDEVERVSLGGLGGRVGLVRGRMVFRTLGAAELHQDARVALLALRAGRVPAVGEADIREG